MHLCFLNDIAIVILFDAHSYSPQTRNQSINSRFLSWKEVSYLKTKRAIGGEKQRRKVEECHNFSND